MKGESNIKNGNGAQVSVGIGRESRIMNCIMNTSVLLVSALMGIFSEVMVDASGAVAGALVDSVSEGEGDKVQSEINAKKPEIDEKMRMMVSDMRKDFSAQFEEKKESIEPYMSSSVFDLGLEIVDKYDFGLPKLTEELSDEEFAQYVLLLERGDSSFGEMFKELADWMNSLPVSPTEPKKE